MTFTYPPFYDVESSVGNGDYPNSQLDVMLVQYLLFSAMYDSSWPLPPTWGQVDPLTSEHAIDSIYPQDGVVGPHLSDWILAFQTYTVSQGHGQLTVDGVISHGGAAWGRTKPRATNFWTIHALNDYLFRSDRARFCTLATDPSVPTPLQEGLGLVVNIDPVP